MIRARLSDAAGHLGWRIVGRDAEFHGVSTDSRKTSPGQLFVALAGERYDGHRFVGEAVSKGAAAAVVSEAGVPVAMDSLSSFGAGPVALAVVGDTLLALGELARWYMLGLGARTAAVTGSTGKTTTKDMLASILSVRRRTSATPESYNNEVGLPLAVLGLAGDCEAFVAEMAMRGRGQIAYLARIARPLVGVVLNVGLTHVELLGSVEAIAQAKAELVEAIPPEGTAVLNAADPLVLGMARRCRGRVVTFDGSTPGPGSGRTAADVTAGNVVSHGPDGVSFEVTSVVSGCAEHTRAFIPVPGVHNVANALAAAAAALAMGEGLDSVAAGLGRVRPSPHRLATRGGVGGFVLLDDSYNASPTSMLAALGVLTDLADRRGGRAIAVLGDMLELGAASAEAHENVGRRAAGVGVKVVVGVGDYASLAARTFRAETRGDPDAVAMEFPGDEWGRSQAAAAVMGLTRPADVVLVKGSHSTRMIEVVRALAEEESGVEDGRDGRDGRDCRDGRDGRDGRGGHGERQSPGGRR